MNGNQTTSAPDNISLETAAGNVNQNTSVISIIGAGKNAITMVSSSRPSAISASVIRSLLKLDGCELNPPHHLITSFIEEFLEEVPPGNLIFPFSILNRWYSAQRDKEGLENAKLEQGLAT